MVRIFLRLSDVLASRPQRAEAPNGVCGEREIESRRIADDRSHSERDGFLSRTPPDKGGTGRGRRPNRGSVRHAESTVQIRESKPLSRRKFHLPKGNPWWLSWVPGRRARLLPPESSLHQHGHTVLACIHSGGEVSVARELHGPDTRFVHGAVCECLTRRLCSRLSSRLPGLPH